MTCSNCGASLAKGSLFCNLCGAPQPVEQTVAQSGAERRQLTVLFCDLVGSTALSASIDPEDLREIVGAYHKCAAEVVRRYDGFVAQYLGDGVLVYFGYPRTSEDEAERAVRAALALVEALARLNIASGRLHARIGIATGAVVVGDVVSSSESDRAAVGATPNLAARLQAFAQPDTVVIGSSTYRLVRNLFDCEDLGEIEAKGFLTPVHAHRVLRPSPVEARFEALRASQSPLTGRDEEIKELARRWQQAKTGEGQVMLLCGEAGIGKSRLGASFAQMLGSEPHHRWRYFCSQRTSNSPLHPFVSQLERAANLATDDDSETKLDKLTALLTSFAPQIRDDVPIVAGMLSIPTEGRYPAVTLSPQQKKERIFAALLVQFRTATPARPALAIFEDVHWIDPTSMELLHRMVEEVARLSVLLIVTFRPEFKPPWEGMRHVTSCRLDRLSPAECATMLERIACATPLPQEVAKQIIERTDGIPLFVEELTKTVLESGRPVERDGAPTVQGPLPPLSIPTSLHASLMARLDRLGPAKEIAQVAAALGREFSYDVLHAVVPWQEAVLLSALDELSKADLVRCTGRPPDVSYSFKHALIQDEAYGSLMRSSQRKLHARIGQVLEDRFPDEAARRPEQLAHHFSEAHLPDNAIRYWVEAGKRAAQRSANAEAISHLSKGLEDLSTLPESPARDRQELELQTAIGTVLIAVHGYAAPRTGAAYHRARVLCQELGDAQALLAALSGEFTYHFVRGEHDKMQQSVQEATRLANAMGDEALGLAAHRFSAIGAMYVGDLARARSDFETILALYDASRHRPPPVHYVHDPKVSALTYLSIVLWLMGYPQQARRSSDAAFAYARDLHQANLAAHVLTYAGAGIDELIEDTPAVQRHADAILELADRHSLHYWRVNGMFLRSWVAAQEGKPQHCGLMREALERRHALGVCWYQVRYLCMLATTHLKFDAPELGLSVLKEAEDLIARNHERLWEAEVKRLEGELYGLGNRPIDKVEACLEQARTLAQAQGAKSIELRAAMSLARLWCGQGKHGDALALLSPIYAWFTEGLDTPDLVAAKALIASLRAGLA
jgi:predicted ATPase/class 3 adenylate cyclase